MVNHEHSSSRNPEQQQATPEQVLRGVMERRGISWEIDDSGSVEVSLVRRDFLTPDGRMLRLTCRLTKDRETYHRPQWDWRLNVSRPLASAEVFEMTNSRRDDQRWQYDLDLLRRDGEDRVCQKGSEIPLSSTVLEALATTIESSQPLGDSMYYAILPSGQDVKIMPDIAPEDYYTPK